jgi:hypothetical protein
MLWVIAFCDSDNFIMTPNTVHLPGLKHYGRLTAKKNRTLTLNFLNPRQ